MDLLIAIAFIVAFTISLLGFIYAHHCDEEYKKIQRKFEAEEWSTHSRI